MQHTVDNEVSALVRLSFYENLFSLGKKQETRLVFVVRINRCPYYSATGKTLEISQECLLCYNQSQQRSGHVNSPQKHKLLTSCLRFSFLMPDWFFLCNTTAFQKYFWCLQFSQIDCKWVEFIENVSTFGFPRDKENCP